MPLWLREEIAKRNMLVLAVGSCIMTPLAVMLFVCLVFNLPCPVEDFTAVSRRSEATFNRFLGTSILSLAVFIVTLVYAIVYLRKKKANPRMAQLVTVVFIFILPIFSGILVSGITPDRQLLIFACVEFVVAGFVVFRPFASLFYFGTFCALFGATFAFSGTLDTIVARDIVFLGMLDIAVSWCVYTLFAQNCRRQRIISQMSLHDELTGAKNRHCLRGDFSLFAQEDLFIMICDIDNFKHFNDEYGHNTGDYLLQQFCNALRDAFGEECVYRYGGDEFLVVSPEFGAEEFQERVDKAADQLARVRIDGSEAHLTYSGGYVQGRAEDDEGSRRMLHEADSNLLKAKAAGKNQLVGNLK